MFEATILVNNDDSSWLGLSLPLPLASSPSPPPRASFLWVVDPLFLVRPTSWRHTGHIIGFPWPEFTHMLQHVSSKMWPHRNILMGWSSAPIKGTPRLSTRFIFCFCFGGDFSLFGEVLMTASLSLSGAKSNGSRHIGHIFVANSFCSNLALCFSAAVIRLLLSTKNIRFLRSLHSPQVAKRKVEIVNNITMPNRWKKSFTLSVKEGGPSNNNAVNSSIATFSASPVCPFRRSCFMSWTTCSSRHHGSMAAMRVPEEM